MYSMPNQDGPKPVPPFVQPPAPPTPLTRPKRTYSAAEKWLLLVALCTGILYDRMMSLAVPGVWGRWLGWSGWAIFWLVMTAVFCVLNWEKLRRNPTAWLVGGLSVSLGTWFFRPEPWANMEYAALTILVFPVALMGFAQFVWGGFRLDQSGAFALAWLLGFVHKPFSALGRCFGAAAALVRPSDKGRAVKITVGCAVSAIVLVWLFSAMGEADMVFRYYVNQIVQGLSTTSVGIHIFCTIVMALLMYSFFWNAKYAKVPAISMPAFRLDLTICSIVLISVLAAYALFSAVQFTFLFGGAGLPDGLTYAQYAVSGFWQLIGMAMFNLALFGVSLQYGPQVKWFKGLTAGLIAATGIMLTSAAVRLSMYIAVYNMTWLRLISAWFLIYLAAVLVLCAVRLFWEKLPLIAVSAILLLAWYAALGYANPANLIACFAK